MFRPTPLVAALAEAGLMDARYHRPYTHSSWPVFVGATIKPWLLRGLGK
jgi:hypothetical protein